jgi:hypothetical protein
MLNRRASLTRSPLAKALHLLFITALLAAALGIAPAQSSRAEPAGAAGAVSPQGLLNPDGTLDLSGWEVTLDGERGPVLRPRSGSAAASGMAWYRLPNHGLNRAVFALAVVGSDLYAGGSFVQTADGALTNLGYIARYDTTAGTWHTLPNGGLSSEVRALAAVGSDLYVGGYFTQTADGALTNLGCIARYDTTINAWDALPNQGLDSVVWALEASGSDLYVGGDFTQTGDGITLTNLGRIARYDTAGPAWNALPSQGLNWYVFTLEMVGSDLYVGGLFTQTGDGTTLTNLGHIARYDTAGAAWNALPSQGLDNAVRALAVIGSDLYVGGDFIKTGDGMTQTDLGRIARYDIAGAAWNALPNQGLNDFVIALAPIGGDLYVGGTFTQTVDGLLMNLGRIARYDTAGAAWNALPNQGLSSWVDALMVFGSGLYVGGHFGATGDGSLGLGRIARYGACHEVYLPLVLRQ